MNQKLRGRIRLTAFHVIEKFLRRKLSKSERANLKAGKPVEIDDNGRCGKRIIDIHERRGQGRWLIRYGLTVEAAENGCIEQGKKMLTLFQQEFRWLTGLLGRRGLPITIILVMVDPNQNWRATELPIEQIVIDDIADRGG